jgi:hypothetical protein
LTSCPSGCGWEQVARNSRQALALLGYPIASNCLPGEAEPCGGTFAEHAMAHLATLKAVCDHQLDHLDHPEAGRIHESERSKLAINCPHGVGR